MTVTATSMPTSTVTWPAWLWLRIDLPTAMPPLPWLPWLPLPLWGWPLCADDDVGGGLVVTVGVLGVENAAVGTVRGEGCGVGTTPLDGVGVGYTYTGVLVSVGTGVGTNEGRDVVGIIVGHPSHDGELDG